MLGGVRLFMDGSFTQQNENAVAFRYQLGHVAARPNVFIHRRADLFVAAVFDSVTVADRD
jgi:hypothetical protein